MRANWIPEKLPEDIESERSLLATLCAPGAETQAAEVVPALRDDDFVHPHHRLTFRALRSLLSEQSEVSVITLRDAVVRMGEGDRLPFTTLVEILGGEDVMRPQVLADILRRKASLRRLIHLGAKLVRQASGEEGSPEALIEQASSELVDLAQGKTHKGLKLLADVGDQALARIREVAEGRRSAGIGTGLPRLDEMTGGGFKPGELIILAARPGVGKTTLAMEWAQRAADRAGTVAFFSLEMSESELWNRMAANQAGIPSHRLKTGHLSGFEWSKLEAAKDDLQQLPLLVNDQAEISVPEIRGQVDRAIARFGSVGLVVVDYLQLISSQRGSQAARQNESVRVAEISRGLKLLAKDRGVPVVVLSQLNRESEKRQGGRPQLSDLRDSGAIEQDADVVAFLHRKITPGDDQDTSAELIIAKQRSGPTGVIYLTGDLQHFRFVQREREAISTLKPVALKEFI